MRFLISVLGASAMALGLSVTGAAQQTPDRLATATVVQANLIEAGSPPFHLRATITERGDPSFKADVEIDWAAPDQWRRTIRSQDFSQTLIVNRGKVFEQDSDGYFPLGLETLVTAMVDPGLVLRAFRQDDRAYTKANGASTEDGEVCYTPDRQHCSKMVHGLFESVGSAGHSVDFTDYRDFHGKRVARILFYIYDPGSSLKADITDIRDLRNAKKSLFAIEQETPKEEQIRNVVLSEAELRTLALETPEIIWPQVIDGATAGSASYYVVLDRSGRVREALPVRSANERANESACRQILKWKFKPVMKDGYPAQAESLLTFTLNTRAFGPSSPLSDVEARKLASNIVEPSISPGSVPSGTTFTLRAAIDAEGRLIEVIAGEGEHKMFASCYQALKQWQFKPLMQDGQPRPYRAEIVFRAP